MDPTHASTVDPFQCQRPPKPPRPLGPKTPLSGRPLQLVLFSPLPMTDEHVETPPPPPILSKSGVGIVLGFFCFFWVCDHSAPPPPLFRVLAC
jgi:hypothetical protein